MLRLRLSPKTKLKITQRYLEKLQTFNLSYFELHQKYLDKTSLALDSRAKTENTASLEAILLEQIEALAILDKDKIYLEKMLNYLDGNGLFTQWSNLENILKDELKVSQSKLLKLLAIFQDLEPEGVGARSVVEFLQIQINRYAIEDDRFRKALIAVLKKESDLISGDIDKIARELQLSRREIDDILFFVKNNLNHVLPGKQYITTKAVYIYPSAEISLSNGKFIVKMLENFDFISNPQLLKDLQERKKILKQILQEFCKQQKTDLFQEFSYLQPITQREVAQRLELSPSFISRLVNRKYVQINGVTILMRNLFQRKIKDAYYTHYFIKQLMAKKENAQNTDKQIQDKLNKMGINISRRTVNYYRHKIVK